MAARVHQVVKAGWGHPTVDAEVDEGYRDWPTSSRPWGSCPGSTRWPVPWRWHSAGQVNR